MALSGRDVGAASVVVGGSVATGLAAGAVWAAVSPRRILVVGADGLTPELTTGDPAFAAEGWFGVVGAGAGVLLALWTWWRYREDVAALLGLAVGGVLGASVAWLLGRWLGPDALPPSAFDLPVGTRVPEPIDVRAHAMLLIWPLVAVATYFSLTIGQQRSAKPDPEEELAPSEQQ
jgi:hypothetical protein